MKLSKEAKVGLVVTAAIAALIWGINFLKGSELFSSTKTIFAVYRNIDGLVASNQVLLNGYKVGQVKKLRFIHDNSGRILAFLQVRNDVFIARNSVARIVSSDLLGGKAVEIILGDDSEAAVHGDTLASDLTSGIAEQFGPMKDKAENLMQSLDTVAEALHLLLDEKSRNNLSAGFEHMAIVMANLERITRSLDLMLTPNSGSLRKTIDHMQSVSGNLRDHNADIGNSLRNLSGITDSLARAGLTATVGNLNASLAQLNTLLGDVNAGKGSLGKLATDDSLYLHLSAMAADLDTLLIDMRVNPKRYVHFSLFGKKGR